MYTLQQEYCYNTVTYFLLNINLETLPDDYERRTLVLVWEIFQPLNLEPKSSARSSTSSNPEQNRLSCFDLLIIRYYIGLRGIGIHFTSWAIILFASKSVGYPIIRLIL